MKEMLFEKVHGDDIKVTIGQVTIGSNKKVLISGPCSVESYEHTMSMAAELKKIGVDIIRGGAFKPRTSPYDFQGLKYEGLRILGEVRKSVGIPVVSEILDPRDVEAALDYIDMIQIGSRNMYNYSLLKEVGKTHTPILLKRGMSATIVEWMKAAEYILAQGNEQVVLCERGIRTFETYTRNTLDLNAVAVIKHEYRLPVIVDPSHGTGLRELVPTMAKAAIAAGADGLMIESHQCPEQALSDARQTVSIEILQEIYADMKKFESIM